MKPDVLGIDVGGVILDFIPYFGTDLDFGGDNYLRTPEIEGAIDSVEQLNKGRFKDRVHIITKYNLAYGPGRAIEWLEHKNFFQRTGIPMERYHFCAERHQKAAICAQIGVTHFIDDRAEVLSEMIDQVQNLYLFRFTDADKEELIPLLQRFVQVNSWQELMQKLK